MPEFPDDPDRALNVLGLCGSLRAASINAALLRAAARLAPAPMAISLFDPVGRLPLFNPDLEIDPPTPVRQLREAVAHADALLIASPEYAHGVTGTIKNALDWLVSFEPFVHKPVVVWNASPRAHHADDALRETLRTMSADIVDPASVSIALLGAQLGEDGMVASPAVSGTIRAALLALRDAVEQGSSKRGPSFRLG
jgi:chromate reductase, NAD(P)H dehydrogenase (quinone)